MRSVALCFVLFLACGAGIAQNAVADLVAGGSVSGTVASVDQEGVGILEGDRVRRIRWSEMSGLRSEQPVTATLANGDRVTLTITGYANGRLQGAHDTFGAIGVPVTSMVPPAAAPAEAVPPPAGPAAPAAPADASCCKPCTPLTPKPWKGKVAFSGTVRSGNVDSVLAALHAEATKDCAADRFTAAIDALYGKTDEEISAESVGGKGRWDHFYTSTFYSYASAEALYDRIQNLDLRAIVGIGAGDFLWKCSDDRSWSVEGGISALYEDFSTSDDAELAPAGRLATTYKEVLFDDLKFEQQVEILVPLDDFGRYLARSRTLFGVPLCKDLALRLSLELTYQGDPPDDSEALDVLGLVGIEYQF